MFYRIDHRSCQNLLLQQKKFYDFDPRSSFFGFTKTNRTTIQPSGICRFKQRRSLTGKKCKLALNCCVLWFWTYNYLYLEHNYYAAIMLMNYLPTCGTYYTYKMLMSQLVKGHLIDQCDMSRDFEEINTLGRNCTFCCYLLSLRKDQRCGIYLLSRKLEICRKWANPGIFLVYFSSFQTNYTIFTTNQCEKRLCPSSIRCRDLNQRPQEYELSPITTRP